MKRYLPTQSIQILGRLILPLTLLLSSTISTQALACDEHITHAQSVWIGIMEKYGNEEQVAQARKIYTDAHKDLPLTSALSGKVESQTTSNSSLVDDVKKLIAGK